MSYQKKNLKLWIKSLEFSVYIVILGIFSIRIVSFSTPSLFNSFLLIRYFLIEILFQILLIFFFFRNFSLMGESVKNWLVNTTTIGILGTSIEITYGFWFFVQNDKLMDLFSFESVIMLNFLLICFFILISLKSTNNFIINFFSWIMICIGLNSLSFGFRFLLLDFNDVKSFIAFLQGLQIILFVYLLLYNRKKRRKFNDNTRLENRYTDVSARLAIIIPAHNEEKLIRSTLSNIPKRIDKIYVIDDASKDQTGAIVNHYSSSIDNRVQLITHDKNQGVGASIISGYLKAYEDNYDIFIVIGGDAQMDPDDLPTLIEPIYRNEADYTKGNRFIYGKPFSRGNAYKEMPKLRLVGNIILSFLTKICTGYKNIFDSQMGYTAIYRDVIPLIDWSSVRKGYGYPGEWLSQFHTEKIRVKDTPVRAIYLKNEQQTQIKVRNFLFYTSGVMFKAYIYRLYKEYFLAKNRQRSITSSFFLLLTLFTPIGIIFFPFFSQFSIYLMIIGFQGIFFFMIADLAQDNLSITTLKY